MDFRFEHHLFLGKSELNWIKKSLREKGYKSAVTPFIGTYGVIRPVSDTSFNSLKVIQGTSPTKVTVKSGTAIDLNIDLIDIENDLVDVLTIPSDGVTRYIKLTYQQTTIEEGTINLGTLGDMTGIGTSFIDRLRGLPFPSRISFPNSINNPLEYDILSVASDTSAQLNTALGVITAETDLSYKVVGTFTPGSNPSAPQKYPFLQDNYALTLEATDTVIQDVEFILASVSSDGSTLTIIDLRPNSLFSSSNSLSVNQTSNTVIGIEQLTYSNAKNPFDFNLLKIGWGLRVNTTDWTFNQSLNQLTIINVFGGTWKDTSFMTNGALDGWTVVVKQTGERVRITQSILSGSDIVCILESTSLNPAHDLVINPSCESIQFLVTSQTSKLGTNTYFFDINEGCASMPILAGDNSTVKWRQISGLSTSAWTDLNTGTYCNELQFNTLGIQIGGPNVTHTSGGLIPAALHTLNHSQDKASRSLSNTFVGRNDFLGVTDIKGIFQLGDPGVGTTASPGTYNNANISSTRSLTSLNVLTAGVAEFTGILADALGLDDGRVLVVRNISYSSGAQLKFYHQSAGSTAINRLNLSGGVDRTLNPGQSITFIYDNWNSRWNESLGGLTVTPWISMTAAEMNAGIILAAPVLTGISLNTTNSKVYYKVDLAAKEFHLNMILTVDAPSAGIQLDGISMKFPQIANIENGMMLPANMNAGATGSHTSNVWRPAECRSVYIGSDPTIQASATGFDTNWTSSSGSRYVLYVNGILKLQ